MENIVMSDGKWYNDVKVVGAYLGESNEKKTPFFAIEFSDKGVCFEWKAWLTKTPDQKTGKTLQMKNLETLHKIGFCGKDLPDLADDTKQISELFGKTAHPINILVKTEHYTNRDGLPRTTDKVEAVTVSAGKSKMDKAQSVAKFSSMNTGGDLAAIRAQLGANKAQESNVATDANFASDDIPF